MRYCIYADSALQHSLWEHEPGAWNETTDLRSLLADVSHNRYARASLRTMCIPNRNDYCWLESKVVLFNMTIVR